MTEPTTEAGRALLDWTLLANVVRSIDGNHDLGAGEFAERLSTWLRPHVRLAEQQARQQERDAQECHGRHVWMESRRSGGIVDWDENGPVRGKDEITGRRCMSCGREASRG